MQTATTYARVLGTVIAQRRAQRRERQAQVAKVLGIMQSSYSKLECGSSQFSTAQICNLASHFECPVAQLFVETDALINVLTKAGVRVLAVLPPEAPTFTITVSIIDKID